MRPETRQCELCQAPEGRRVYRSEVDRMVWTCDTRRVSNDPTFKNEPATVYLTEDPATGRLLCRRCHHHAGGAK